MVVTGHGTRNYIWLQVFDTALIIYMKAQPKKDEAGIFKDRNANVNNIDRTCDSIVGELKKNK